MVGLPPLPTPGLSFPELRTVVLALSDETVPSPGLVVIIACLGKRRTWPWGVWPEPGILRLRREERKAPFPSCPPPMSREPAGVRTLFKGPENLNLLLTTVVPDDTPR